MTLQQDRLTESPSRGDETCPSGPFTLPDLMIGGAVFSHHYNTDIDQDLTKEILSRAISSGANAFDTSPYYGSSELVMGAALSALRSKHPRNSYVLVTKCGRLALDEFDYSGAWIRQSVQRSLERLCTSYLDIVFLHDAEFVSADEVVEGATALLELRREGVIRAFGLSGYTLSTLLSHAQVIKATLGFAPECLFSYSHYNLQNSLLEEYVPRFKDIGVRFIINGSPLSMGLLRAEGPPDWHPASERLKAAAMEASRKCQMEFGQKLAEVALGYSLGFEGTTCVGCSTLAELNTALGALEASRTRNFGTLKGEEDKRLFAELKVVFGQDGIETVWAAPPVGWTRKFTE